MADIPKKQGDQKPTPKKVKKFELEKDKKLSLNLYFFSIQLGRSIIIEIPYDLRVIIAYTDQEALDSVRKEYSPGTILHVTKKGQLLVRDLLTVIDLGGEKPAVTSLPIEPPEEIKKKEKKTKEAFINELLLVTNEFVGLKKDQEMIKEILKRVKI